MSFHEWTYSLQTMVLYRVLCHSLQDSILGIPVTTLLIPKVALQPIVCLVFC